MQIFRAVAYRLQRANTPPAEQWPDITVFFESTSMLAAKAELPALLALAWGCRPADVEFYNCTDEPDLLAGSGMPGAQLGDAALLVSGWFHGPLFCRPDRTQLFVRPFTQARLQAARMATRPWQLKQRAAAQLAAGVGHTEVMQRHQLMTERLEAAADTGMGAFF